LKVENDKNDSIDIEIRENVSAASECVGAKTTISTITSVF
jgi:hypothetical protein